MKRFISILAVVFLFVTSFSSITFNAFAEEKDPLKIDTVLGLTDTVGTFRMATQDGSLFSPLYQMGIFVSEDETIFVGDSGESQVEIFESNLTPKSHFGTIGKEDGEYMYLTSINMCKNGNLYITDSFTGSITVTKKDGTFIKKIQDKDHMSTPTDVDFLSDGSILVCDATMGLLKFDSDGNYLDQFTSYDGVKPSPDDLYGPTQIEVSDDEIIYVAASSITGICKLAAFDKDGNHVSDCIEVGADPENIGGLITGISIEDNILVLCQINGQSTQVKKYEIPSNPSDLLEYLEIIATVPSGRNIEDSNVLSPGGCYIQNGNVYVLEGILSRLLVFDKNNDLINGFVSTANGDPIYTIGFLYSKDSPKGILSNPQGVRVDVEGNVFVGNSNFANVVVFDNEGEDIEHLGKPATSRNPDAGEFFSPTDVCFDQEGFIYVSDTQAGLIHVFDEDFEPWALIDESFSYPQGLCVNNAGELLVVNSRSASLSIVDISEMIDEYAFEIDAYPIDGEWPVGISCNAKDDMFIALTGSDKIVSMDVDGDTITEWGESGSNPGQLNGPQGTCVDGAGNVYVAETNGGRIQKFTPDGDLLWTSDLQWPGLTFITMGFDGRLYVTDCLHSTVVVLEDETAVPPDDGSVKESNTIFNLEVSEEIKADHDFSIALNVKDIEEIKNITFGLTFSDDLISFDSIEKGDLLGPGTVSKPDKMDNTLIFDMTCGAGITGSGTLAILHFHAEEMGKATVNFDRVKMVDKNDKEVAVKETNNIEFEIMKGDTEPPVIEIEEIPEVVWEDTYTIKGSTEADAKVTINDKEIKLDKDGTFTFEATLKVGDNEFIIKATDLADNTAEKKIVIVRKTRTVLKFIVGRKTYMLNGDPGLLDAAPFVHEGRTVLPIRPVVEAINGEIGWDGAERKVTIKKGDILIELWIDNPKAKINGREVQIDDNPSVKPMIVSGRTFLPLRFVAENLGFAVGWDGETQTITLTYPKP